MPTAEINGLRIHYDIVGEGEPVVFLNGVMMTTRSWVLQTSLFRRRYRCLLHDFRGQLLSDKPEEPWFLEDHADDLRALLDHLAIERCHLVGTSYGGEVGLIFAYTFPDRVKSLSVVSSASEVGPEMDRAVASWAKAALEAPETLYRVALPYNYSPAFVEANSQVIEQGEARVAACPPEFFPAFTHLVDAFRRLDITAELDRITCPTLVLVGERDALKPPQYSRLIAERIAHSELLVVPGGGHAVILEKPQEINTALLGFLEKHR
ncbi:MAG: alpha/beta fold hydrolase [Thermoanaerobaculia bacterium]